MAGGSGPDTRYQKRGDDMLERGTWIRSRRGETARDEHDELVRSGPNALGCIQTVDRDQTGKAIYSVIFRNNVWVFLHEDELADPDSYEVPANLDA